MRLAALLIAASLAAACSPPANTTASAPSASTAAASAAAQFEPTAAMQAEHPDCRWEEIRAAGVAINSFACANARLVGDETLPGFYLVTTQPNGATTRTVVVRVFTRPADAPVDAVLGDVRAASPGWATAACVFAPADSNIGARAIASYELMPTGAGLEAWEACLNLERDQGCRPCGDMGPTEGSWRTFEILDGALDKLVYVDRGRMSGQVYYPETLRAVQ